MRASTTYRRVLAGLIFSVLAAGDFWRNLLGWWGWGALVLVVVAGAIVELVRVRVDLRILPIALIAFLVLSTVSIVWSAYPSGTAVGIAITLMTTAVALFIAACFDWEEVLDLFAAVLRWILGLSLIFEFVVAAFIGHPVLPLWVDYSHLEKIPAAFYWSRGLLFEGGRIQGIVGNANLLGMIALLGLILFTVRVLARRGSPIWGWFWILVSVLTLALTRSSTVFIAGAVVVVVAGFALAVRATRGGARIAVTLGGLVIFAGAAVVAALNRSVILDLLGKSSDLTHRAEIWQKVGDLAVQRPVVGWGWVGYWTPWTPPFDNLIVIGGVHYYQAHNAWLDMFLQLGIIGVVIFGILVLSTLLRSWILAVDTSGPRVESRAIRWPTTLVPLLLLTAYLVQSLAESRLLIELGLGLLVILAVKTGWRDSEGVAWRLRR